MQSSKAPAVPDIDVTEDDATSTCTKGENEIESRAFAEAVQRAMTRAVKEAIADHHRHGHPVSIMRDGRIVLLYPDGTEKPLKEPGQEP